MGLLPKAPDSKSTTDFVVAVFVITVATLLVMMATATIVGGFMGGDIQGYVNGITDIITTIIGALIGYIAGKGQGRSEAHDERMEHDERMVSHITREPEPPTERRPRPPSEGS